IDIKICKNRKAKIMHGRSLKILLASENDEDCRFTQSFTGQIRDLKMVFDRVSRCEQVAPQLRRETYDVVLLDSHFGGGCLQPLKVCRDAEWPVVVLADVEDHEVDVAATEAGAYDYLVKKHINAPLLER